MTIAFTLRDACADDRDWARALHRRAYEDVVTRQFGPWDDARQGMFFEAAWHPGTTRVVCIDGRSVGLIRVEPEPDRVRIVELQVDPRWQGRGIGAALLRRVLETAGARVVELQVLHANRRARALYQRSGFRVIGTTATHVRMSAVRTSSHGHDARTVDVRHDEGLRIVAFAREHQAAARALIELGLEAYFDAFDASRNPDLVDIGAAHPDGFVVALAGGAGYRLVGTAGCRREGPDTLRIVRVSVAADLRRGGVGRALVEDRVRHAVALGMRRVVVETTRGWSGAIRFWKACGFVATGEDEIDVHLERRLRST